MSDTLETKQEVYTVLITFKGETISLQPEMIKELYFIEDIFSPCIVGKLTLEDKFGLKDNQMLTGEEIITVIYGLENKATKYFYIYKIKDISPTNPGGHRNIDDIEIFFVDASFLIFTQRQISYSWAAMGGDEIIKDLLINICKIPEERLGKWENSGSQYEYFYSPYWTVLQNINFLLPRMSFGDSDNKRSGFLFYSSTEDIENAPKFNLVTLQTLLSQSENDILKVNDSDDGQYLLFKASTTDLSKLNKILDWSISGIDKTAFNILQGGKAVGFNQTTKKPIEQTYTYSDLVSKTMVLGNYTLFDDISDKNNYVKVCPEGDADLLDNVFYDEWVKKYCLQQTFTITVLGHEKRCCGKMIYIPWKQEGDDKTEAEENAKYTGGFLIKSVTHYFKAASQSYYQKLTLIKNGYQNLDSVNDGAVMKQTDQKYRNSFDGNSFTSIDWNTYNNANSSGLFNRQSSASDYVNGLLKSSDTANVVNTQSWTEKIAGWFK